MLYQLHGPGTLQYLHAAVRAGSRPSAEDLLAGDCLSERWQESPWSLELLRKIAAGVLLLEMRERGAGGQQQRGHARQKRRHWRSGRLARRRRQAWRRCGRRWGDCRSKYGDPGSFRLREELTYEEIALRVMGDTGGDGSGRRCTRRC